jgi:hypothetical protein
MVLAGLSSCARECPRMPKLMYPSRTRGTLSVPKTNNEQRTTWEPCARLRLARSHNVSLTLVSSHLQQVDRERDRESERHHDPDELASVLEGLGHHRVGEHGQDRAGREGQNEGDHLR